MPYQDPYFRLLIEHSSDAIALVSREGKIVYASPAIKRILGYSSTEFQKINVINLINQDDLVLLTDQIKTLVENRGKTVRFQCRVIHKDGTWRWIESVSTNLLDQVDLQALVFNFRDITDQKEIELRKDEFISIASHELKTPLASLKGFAQILVRAVQEAPDPEKILHYSLKINDQIDRLAELVGDLLDVSKIRSGKLELNRERFSIDTLILEIAEDMQDITPGLKIETSLQANRQIYADKYRISQVLVNLISNAIKYSPKEQKIVISSKAISAGIQISVQDFGIGIFKKDLDHIFEQFYQARNKIRKSFSGLGLGLYISSEIIKRHGGKIWAESEKGVGSTFFVVLSIK